ncbi:arginine--tRNA ligase, partial [Euryarchaeota archaeon]|nr:arginine--tRNA ligase [Euryarchaeota archaeon]
MRELHNEIVPKLSTAMVELGLNENQWLNSLGSSTDKTHGDITLPCHTLSKILRKSPNDIAIAIANNLDSELSEIAEINIVNGFLNFKAKNSWIS